MIVDDSTVARAVLSRMIESDPAFEIAAVAGSAEAAVEALGECRVDIVLLDLEMPGAGGLKSIPRIIAAAAGAKVMIVSSLAEEGAEQTVAALALGAADTLPKPGTGRFNGKFSEILLDKLKALGFAPAPLLQPSATRKSGRRRCCGRCRPIRSTCSRSALRLAASTRSACLFHALPKRIGVPILVTQHLPIPFMQRVRSPTRRYRPAPGVGRRGRNGASPRPHLARARRCASDARASQEWRGGPTGPRPEQQRLHAVGRSDARVRRRDLRRRRARRGADRNGPRRRRGRGASWSPAAVRFLPRTRRSCAVWGMPRAVLEAGLASAALPPDKIARRIASRTEEPAECK